MVKVRVPWVSLCGDDVHADVPRGGNNGLMFERYSESARRLIFISLWSARRRGGPYIEPEDLLHALIREDRGEFPAISSQVFDGYTAPIEGPLSEGRRFFPSDVAANLLRELDEDPDPLVIETAGEKAKPVPHVDMPVSNSLKGVLALVAQAHQRDTKTIEPLDLLAGIVENPDSRLAKLLSGQGITPQKVANALDSGS